GGAVGRARDARARRVLAGLARAGDGPGRRAARGAARGAASEDARVDAAGHVVVGGDARAGRGLPAELLAAVDDVGVVVEERLPHARAAGDRVEEVRDRVV